MRSTRHAASSPIARRHVSSRRSADERYGSFCSVGARKLSGYQVLFGGRRREYVNDGRSSRGTRSRMLRGRGVPTVHHDHRGADSRPSGGPAVTTGWPCVRIASRRQHHGRQSRFDLGREPALPSAAASATARVSLRLVDQESGRQRRHLEQHAARLTKVDRREVAAIADVGDTCTRTAMSSSRSRSCSSPVATAIAT